MSEATVSQKAKMLKDVLVEVKVEADLSGMLCRPPWRYKDPLELAEDLKKASNEFHDFLRDHRSQDMVKLNVIQIRKNLCSVCKNEWDAYEDQGKEVCRNCGVEVDKEE